MGMVFLLSFPTRYVNLHHQILHPSCTPRKSLTTASTQEYYYSIINGVANVVNWAIFIRTLHSNRKEGTRFHKFYNRTLTTKSVRWLPVISLVPVTRPSQQTSISNKWGCDLSILKRIIIRLRICFIIIQMKVHIYHQKYANIRYFGIQTLLPSYFFTVK